jgi:hypothetical protein
MSIFSSVFLSSLKINREHSNLPLNTSYFLILTNPGIYLIYNITNEMRYYGET